MSSRRDVEEISVDKKISCGVRPNSSAYRERSHRWLACLVVVFGAVALLLPISAAVAQKDTATSESSASKVSVPSLTGNAESGRRLFVSDGCYECHGNQGQGAATTGPRIAPNPIPMEGIMSYIRRPSGRMPPFSAKLVPDQDVADIYAYLKSVSGPGDVKNVPLFTK